MAIISTLRVAPLLSVLTTAWGEVGNTTSSAVSNNLRGTVDLSAVLASTAVSALPACEAQPNYEQAKGWCGSQGERYACYKDASDSNPVWDCRVSNPTMCKNPCVWSGSSSASAPPRAPAGLLPNSAPAGMLPMEPSCDDKNVGFPNCPGAQCATEYRVEGNSRILKASSTHCAYTTFKTRLSLRTVIQLDADVWITPHTCSAYDNLAFWFFQATDHGQNIPEQAWSTSSEVDLFETYIGPGFINSVNTNFAGNGLAVAWNEFSITDGMHQHVTMWRDIENVQGCPASKVLPNGKAVPVVSIYITHCGPGKPCCKAPDCARLRDDPRTARSCVTVNEAPILFVLSNWGSGHTVTPGCEIGVSDVTLRSQ